MSTGLNAVNKALTKIPKRAEQQQVEQLRSTFVDSGVAAALAATDNQVLYGRRGTGKTHALRYLESEAKEADDVAVYVDLRTVGSADGLFGASPAATTDRALRLLIDVIGQVHDALLSVALEDEDLISDPNFVRRLDRLAESVTKVEILGEVEVSEAHGSVATNETRSSAGVNVSSNPSVEMGAEGTKGSELSQSQTKTVKGSERRVVNFSEVARALRDVVSSVGEARVWLLLDEWSSLPGILQPYLGEFLVRCVFPLQSVTVKIAAIEQQSNFRDLAPDGTEVGIELGADVAANLDLDEFMVYEQNEDRSREFFKDLLYKHVRAVQEEDGVVPVVQSEREFVRHGFTNATAFDELVRAAEGVPRDAINIASKAALRAGSKAISVPDVRAAARSWYQADKEGALRGNPEALRLLNWVIDDVIRQKRARGFLVEQRASRSDVLLKLYDARVLHLVRRGYSSPEEPGQRFDVWVIDYGAYVDLINTKLNPTSLLSTTEPDSLDESAERVEVPISDFRAIRRALLDMQEFERNSPDR